MLLLADYVLPLNLSFLICKMRIPYLKIIVRTEDTSICEYTHIYVVDNTCYHVLII